MSIFKRKMAKAQQEPQPEATNFNQEPPITGGNTYEMRQILQAQDNINKNTIPKLPLHKYTNKITEETYNFWYILQFHANYFTSLMRVRTDNPRMNELIYNCFRVHFLFGGCGIYKKGETIMALYENKVHVDATGEITKIEFKNIHDLLAARGIDDYKSAKVCLTLTKDELKNYARLRPTSIGFGAIVTWMPFVKQQVSLLKKIYMYNYVFHRKITYKAADISTSNFELDAFFNEDIPFYVELDADLGTGNKFTTESINNGTSGGVTELETFYNFFIETYYHLLGRRYNVDDKKERNLSTEINASQSNFDVLHNEDRIVKTDFLNEMTRICGIEWEDLDEKEREEQRRDIEATTDRQDMGRDNRSKQ